MRPFPIEELVDRVGSRFSVVIAAAKRAKQIKDGARPLVELPTRNPLTIAMYEIASGVVEITEPIAAEVDAEVEAVIREELEGSELDEGAAAASQPPLPDDDDLLDDDEADEFDDDDLGADELDDYDTDAALSDDPDEELDLGPEDDDWDPDDDK